MAAGDLVSGQIATYQATANALTHPPAPVNLPSAPTVGNTLFIVANASAVISTPAGYVLDGNLNVTQNNDMRVFRRTVVGGDGTAIPTLTLAVSRPCTIDFFEVEGVAVLDATSTPKTFSGAATGALTTNSVVTVAATVLMIAAISPERTVASTVSSWLNSFTEHSDLQPTGGTSIYGCAVATRKVTAQGTYSTGATIDATATTTAYDTLLASYSFGGGGGGGSTGQYVGMTNH